MTETVSRENDDAMELSVVVVLLGGADHLERWLAAIATQVDAPAFEVVIPHDRRFGDPPCPLAIPNARYLPHDGERTYAELRSAGIRASVGRHVVITEDHCVPPPEWCRAIVDLHTSLPHAAIGGPLHKTGSDTLLNWAVYLQDFSRYMMPVPAGPTGYLTDCNVSYKRARLDELHALWHEEFHETPVNWTFLEQGDTLWLAPEMAVGQRRDVKWGPTVRERYRFGRLFASTRVGKVGKLKGLAYAVLVWVLPMLIVTRVGRDVLSRRTAVGTFAVTVPLIAFLASVWATGELIGYVTGRAGEGLSPAEGG